jgi:predicted permease
MSIFSTFRAGLHNLTGRSAVEAELDEELQTYVELLVAENVSNGASPRDARRAAMLKVGGIERVKDEVRDVRPGMMFETIMRDVAHGFRMVRRSPAFAFIAVITIAIGIGATSAIFSVINAVALKPLAYPAAEQLVFVSSQFSALGLDKFWVSPPEYLELAERARSFSGVAAYRADAVNLSDGTRPERVNAVVVTANMFTVLGVQPKLGRGFTPDEDLPNANPVAVLSDNIWRSRFSADPAIIGKLVEIQGQKRTIVGVLPPGFDLHDAHADVWMPLGLDPSNRRNRGSHFLFLVARLKLGVTQSQAKAELTSLNRQWSTMTPGAQHMPNDSTHRIQLVPLRDEVIGNVAQSLWLLQGAVVLVLLIACANVANLLMVRAESRHREFAIRTALGARRSTILRQFMAEGLVLTFLAALLGLGVARWGLSALLAANPESIPRAAEIAIDPRVLLFTMLVAIVTSVVFGLAPVFHLSQNAVASALKEGGTRSTSSSSRHRIRRSLVGAEIALAVVLVIGAGLLMRSFANLTAVDAGFDARNLTTFSVFLPEKQYPDNNQRAQLTRNLMQSLEHMQGVSAVAATTGLPPSRSVVANDTQFENVPMGPGLPQQNIDYWTTASVNYFTTMKIPIVEGRGFLATDIQGTGVAIINQATARRFYGATNPVGRRLRPPGADSSWLTIVGVAKDVKQGGLDQKVGTEVYFNLEQSARGGAGSPASLSIVVRSSRSTDALAIPIQSVMRALDPGIPVVQLKSMNAVFGDSVSRQRFLSLLLGAFTIVALLLAAIGTYGVLSYLVTERRREIGIRAALGASASGIVQLVLRQGLSITAVGIVAGIGGALLLARLARSLLFGVSSFDPLTYIAVAGMIVFVALVACLVPAYRAVRVDPLIAIRNE